MPVRRNGEFNDPLIGEAVGNLATAFGPPKGSDIYAYTRAAAARADAARLAEVFRLAQDPNASQELRDRIGVGAGMYAPNASYYSVDRGNETSRANNRDLVAGQLDVARINNAGALERQDANPIILKENETARLPGRTQKATGLPEMFSGQRSVKQGEMIIPAEPGVDPILGPAKPLNESEWKAAQAETQRKQGTLTDPMITAAIMGNTPVETVQTDQGPRYQYRTQAVGQEPTPDATKTPKPELGTTATGESAEFKNGQWYYTQKPGQPPVPPEIQVTKVAQPAGAAKDVLASTPTNIGDANKQSAEIFKTRDLLTRYKDIISKNPGTIGAVGMVRGTVQDIAQSIREAADAFVKDPKKIDEYIKKAEDLASQKGFDPEIARAEFLRHVLAYRLAKALDQSGEVNVKEMEKNLATLGSGLTANQRNVIPKIEEFEQLLNKQQESLGILRDPKSAPSPPAGGAAGTPKAEVWIRGPDGRPMRQP